MKQVWITGGTRMVWSLSSRNNTTSMFYFKILTCEQSSNLKGYIFITSIQLGTEAGICIPSVSFEEMHSPFSMNGINWIFIFKAINCRIVFVRYIQRNALNWWFVLWIRNREVVSRYAVYGSGFDTLAPINERMCYHFWQHNGREN